MPRSDDCTSMHNLSEMLDQADQAKSCIAENRGYEKEQAYQAYEEHVRETLLPTLKEALDDLDTKNIHTIARLVLKKYWS